MLTIDFIFRGEDTRIFVAELQEAFDTTRRMFRSLSVVSMWQTQHQPRPLLPFRLSRRQKLINNTLRILPPVSDLSHTDRGGSVHLQNPQTASHT